jgi:hypothetical protein
MLRRLLWRLYVFNGVPFYIGISICIHLQIGWIMGEGHIEIPRFSPPFATIGNKKSTNTNLRRTN